MLSLSNKLTINTQPIYRFVNKYSIDFDGVDQCITTDGADTVAQNTTYSFWSKSSQTTDNSVFGHGGENIGAFTFNQSTDRPILYFSDNYYIYWNDTSAQDDGEWHHWVVYVDVTTLTNCKLYCDGVLQTVSATVIVVIAPTPYTESLTIGGTKASSGDYFNGNIDEFAVYDRELTQAEITRMYNTYYSPNRVSNGNFADIGNEEVENGDFSEIGSEEVTNGDFATDSDWTLGSSWSISGGKANYDAVTTASELRQLMSSIAVGKTVKIQFDISDVEAGKNAYFKLECSGDPEAIFGYTTFSEGTYTYYHTIATAFNRLTFFPLNTGTGGYFSIDNISVKEVAQGWDVDDGNLSFPNNTVTFAGGGIIQNLNQNNIFTQNKSYKFTFDVVRVSGTIQPLYGTGGSVIVGASPNINASGTYTLYFNNTSNGEKIFFYSSASANFVGSITNISAKEVGQGWTPTTGWTIEQGQAIWDASEAPWNNNISHAVSFSAGSEYKLILTVADAGANAQTLIRLTGDTTQDIYGYDTIANGETVFNFTSTYSNTTLNLYAYQSGTAPDFTITNVVVQELKHDATNLMLNAAAYQSANPLITSTNSMEFDGADDYMQISNSNNLGVDNFSLSFWVKMDSASNVTFASKWQDNSNRIQFRTETNSGANNLTLQAIVGGVDAWLITGASLTQYIGKWTNIIISINRSGNLLIFINGELNQTVDISSTSATNVDNTGDWYFGKYSTGTFLDGKMTEVGMWDRALTSLEVASLYNQGMPTNLLVNRNDYQSGNPTVFNTKQVDFDGVDQCITTDGADTVLQNTTYSMWVKSSQTGANNGVFGHGSGARGSFHMNFSDKPLLELGADYYKIWSDNPAQDDGEWHHWVVYLATNLVDSKLYIDGVLQSVDSTVSSGSANAYTESLTIGGDKASGGNYFEGKMSQVGIFNSELTADEVSSLYNHGLPIDLSTDQAAYESSSNLVGYWRMGSGTLDSYPLIADQTDATLGSEIVTGDNSTFDTSTGDWQQFRGVLSWDSSIKAGKWTDNNTAGGPVGFTMSGGVIPTSANSVYIIEFQAKSDTSSAINFGYIGETDSFGTILNPNLTNSFQDYKFIFVTTSANQRLYVAFLSSPFADGESYYIDNVSIKEVQGNPAIMTNMASTDIENGSPTITTGLQGYWKMGSGTNDEFPVIYDQVDPTNGSELVTNGDFATDSDWTKGTGWTISNNKANFNTTGNATIQQNLSITTGRTYKIQITGEITSGRLKLSASSGLGDDSEITLPLDTYYTHDGGTNDIQIRTIGASIGYLDNISIKEVGGNPATMTNMVEGNITNQYPLTKIRNYWRMGDGILDGYPIIQDQTSPNLAHIPTTNFITYSEDFSNAAWTKSASTISSNAITSPDGTQNADNLLDIATTDFHGLYQSHDLDADDIVTTSIFVKYNNKQYMSFLTNNNGASDRYAYFDLINKTTHSLSSGITAYIETYANDWLRLSVTSTTAGNNAYYWWNIALSSSTTSYAGDGTGSIYIWGSQLEKQTQDTAYLKSDGVASVRKATTTNLITYSEDLSQYFTSTNGVTIDSTSNLSPIGTSNAYEVTGTGQGKLQTINKTLLTDTTYTFSFYAKNVDATSVQSRIYYDGSGGSNMTTVNYIDDINTTAWARITHTFTTGSSTTNYYLYITNALIGTIQLWGAQLEQQTQAETYAKTTGLPVTIDLFTENNYGTMTNMVAGDIVEDTP